MISGDENLRSKAPKLASLSKFCTKKEALIFILCKKEVYMNT